MQSPTFRFSIIILSAIVIWGCSSGGSTGPEEERETENEQEEPTEYNLSTAIEPDDGGSVEPTSGTYEEGEEVTVEAVANEGFGFVEWTGDVSSQDNPLVFTIEENVRAVANFEDQRSIYAMRLTATNTVDTTETLVLGQAESGSTGFDENLDQEAPPLPPEGSLDARFLINDLDLLKDYRSAGDQEVEWTLQYKTGTGEELVLEWNLSDDTKIEGRLLLTDEEGSFEVDMLNESSHTESGSTSGTLLIQYNR